jgi:uncharacterized protein YjbI with pentapeptide repeats
MIRTTEEINAWREENPGKRLDLSGADLSGAKLSCSDLSDANLHSANLRGANLRYSDLSCSDLSDADLYDADLRDADLYDANLSGANLDNANFRGAIGIYVTSPEEQKITRTNKETPDSSELERAIKSLKLDIANLISHLEETQKAIEEICTPLNGETENTKG